jgi:hypothetical protein
MIKDSRFTEIFENTIPHGSFLSESAIKSCMYQSYKLGNEDVIKWLLENKHLSDNIQYIVDEWNNQNR